MKKRILSMVTILCLLITLFPVTAFAYDIWDYVDSDKCFIGIEPGKTYCGDTYFTTPVSDEDIDEVCWYYYSGGWEQRTVLMPDESGRYKLEAGLGKIYVYVDMTSKTGMGTERGVVINADHTDNDDNHVCDVCGDRLTNKCTDYNMDHCCDTCGAQMGTCEDADHDHSCDYGCGKTFGKCEDANHDHKCDYGCGVTYGTCEDADHDHECDYGCGKTFGEHKAADGTHTCSYCNKPVSTCVDENPKDHKCDICGATLSSHSGGTATCIKQAVCDYCEQQYGELNTTNHVGGTETKDAKKATCTEDGYTGDTYCKGCGDMLSNGTTIEATGHKDTDKNHICDVETCKAKLSDHSGGTATCTDKAVCDYCGNEYGEVDSSNHTGGTEVRNEKKATCTEDGYTGDTYCKGCGKKLSDGTSITKLGHIDENKDHVCDRESCKATISAHSGGKATCTDKAVCEYCNQPYGEVNADNHTTLKHVEAKAATVEMEGNTEYWHCEECGKYFSDKDGKNEITLADTVIAKLTKTDSNNKSPQTGDNNHMTLWLMLLFVSGSTLIGTAVYGKKKKHFVN